MSCKTGFTTSRTTQMVILTQVIQSTGPGGSGTVKFLRIPPLVQKLLSFEVNRVSLSHLPIGSLFVAGDLAWSNANIFRKTFITPQGPGLGSSWPPTQVMFIHPKTLLYFGVFNNSNNPLDQRIGKHRKILGLVKFSTLENLKICWCRLFISTCSSLPNPLGSCLGMETKPPEWKSLSVPFGGSFDCKTCVA